MKFQKIIFLCIIYLLTIFFTIYFCVLYKNSSVNVSYSNVANSIFDVSASNYDVLYNNINNYSGENDVFYVYVASYKVFDLRSFEDMLNDYVTDKNIRNIIYVNADKLKKIGYLERLLSDFNYSESYDIVDNLPVFISFKNGIIADVVNVYGKDVLFLDRFMGDMHD